MKPIYPIVLAAGESRRLGIPKAILPLHGRTVLQTVIDKCRAAGFAPPIVVLGYAADIIRRTIRARCVVNHDYRHGMLSSLKVGLRALPRDAEGFLIYPADYPLVPVADLRRLARVSSKPIVVPSYRKQGGHPVLLKIEMKRELLRAKTSAREVIYRDKSRVAFVTVTRPAVRWDIDTPQDYARAIRNSK